MNRFMEIFKYVVILTILLGVPSYFIIEDFEYSQLSDEPVVLDELSPSTLSQHENQYVTIQNYCIGNRPIGYEKNSLAIRYYAIKECNSDLGAKQVFVITEVKDRDLNFLDDERDDYFTGRLVKNMDVKSSLKSKVEREFYVREDECWMLYEGQKPSVVKKEGTIITALSTIISSILFILFVRTDIKRRRKRESATAIFTIKNVLQDPDPGFVQLQVDLSRGRISKGDVIPIKSRFELRALDVKIDDQGMTRIKLRKEDGIRWKSLIKRTILLEQIL